MTEAVERKVGPRETCPACGSKDVSKPLYCSPGNRAMTGFLTWCPEDGSKHLDQKCLTCRCKWKCTPVEIKR